MIQPQKALHTFLHLFRGTSCFFSIALILCVIFDYGFNLTPREIHYVDKVYHLVWIYFGAIYLYKVIFRHSHIAYKTHFMTWLVGVLLVFSLFPVIFGDGSGGNGVWSNLLLIFSHKYYLVPLLLLLSFVELSTVVMSVVNRKINPALIMVVGFAIVIIVGAILLMLPRSTHVPISIVDSLFISTSAVCVTGLTPLDIATVFTPGGQFIIALLIQIGGLGVMTLTSFFALFFMGGTGLYSQFALRDMVSGDTFGTLVSTLLYILGVTFFIELTGMFCIWLTIHGTLGMSLYQELGFAAFHSVSAFCNAGFSTLTGNLGNPLLMQGHNGFFWVISCLIVMGGIGFPIIANFKSVLAHHIKNGWYRFTGKHEKIHKIRHLTNLNTRIVLVTTGTLLVAGTLSFLLLEWWGAFAAMPAGDKITHAFFNAVSPRTAGFNSVDLTHFSLQSILIYIFLMWVGGAAQSTAGGIKVNTLGVAIANLWAVVRGADRVELYHRELSNDSMRRAGATIFTSFLLIALFGFTLTIVQPDVSPLRLLFETVSALGTVGSSLNTTPLLNSTAKSLIILLMFAGRVGIITLIMCFVRPRSYKYHYPKDKVIIN